MAHTRPNANGSDRDLIQGLAHQMEGIQLFLAEMASRQQPEVEDEAAANPASQLESKTVRPKDRESRESDKAKDMFLVRITICDDEKDCGKGSHEVVEINTNDSLAGLKNFIQEHFYKISGLTREGRVNLKGTSVRYDEKVLKIKVMYAGACNSWEGTCEDVSYTTLTDENCRRTLKMIKEWKGRDILCAIIGAPSREQKAE